ncbi:M15 family metallopeptidase [Arthrobacter mobilis]|uniref:D-alanyl-D-alanine carboxypeptidase family protein n=1 Tax=Arthrobacter mobilis TaxID=2724944 RepID=A0A7X6K2W2_9MICC|nr:M15 family metallopeptidase [Arthrobacter mobilis]NKX53647.1 D-alanyl-D-alanine carboxypeptidase family protein [Arthrobacter mobilis]
MRTAFAAAGLVLLLAACSPGASGPAASSGPVPSATTTPAAGTRGASPAPAEPEKDTPAPPPEPAPPATEPVPAPAEGHDNPARLDVVVNKTRPLKPLDYAPADLRLPAVPLGPGGDAAVVRDATAGAVERMFAAAAADGVPMTLLSGFRSYQTQVSTYQHWVNVNGQAGADRVSARPGYSEHQTGLAVDVGDPDGSCNLSACFGDTAAGQWVARNAHRFGFIVRYQPGQESVTGYAAEPWHLRYVGKDVAADMADRGVEALETYFGLPPAPDYR